MLTFYSTKDKIYPDEIDRNKALYRIIPFDILLQMLTEKKNILVPTSKWEDVYENYIMKENFEFKGKIKSLSELSDDYFGQCWTSKKSSDAMWRIYSPDKKSVRIKTTLGKLWDSVQKDASEGDFRLGKVQYRLQEDIETELERLPPIDISALNERIINSLFEKRKSFSHEKEYRLIYVGKKGSEEVQEGIKSILINPQDLIMDVTFDPRADQAYFERCRNILMEFHYPKGRIRKSTLYAFKPCTIKIV